MAKAWREWPSSLLCLRGEERWLYLYDLLGFWELGLLYSLLLGNILRS